MTKFPHQINLKSNEIMEKLIEANYVLGNLNGLVQILPNPDIVLSIMTLRESKDSSAIENIITTYDKLYKEILDDKREKTSSKEVLNYKDAIYTGAGLINKNNFLSINMIIDTHSKLLGHFTGIRKLPGTVIRNDLTGEIVHTSPQSHDEIIDYLSNLEKFINYNNDNDPLVNMAIIHYQFESIHPFYDGNGRTGRILNILYLMLKNKIDIPIIYLSKYIKERRDEYYELLSLCNNDINNIYKSEIVIHLFKNMYTKNELFRNDLNISRNTATRYLKLLEEEGFVISEKVGNEVIYKNVHLFNIIENV